MLLKRPVKKTRQCYKKNYKVNRFHVNRVLIQRWLLHLSRNALCIFKGNYGMNRSQHSDRYRVSSI